MNETKINMTVKIDPVVKMKFEEICEELGMPMSVAISMLAKQMIRDGKFPFTPYTINKKEKIDKKEKVTLNFRLDSEVRDDFGNICNELGMTMTNAIIMLARQMVREQKLPFTPDATKKSVETYDYNIVESGEVINVENTTNNNEFDRFIEYMKKFKDMQK